ncbi:DUF5454 family protein [Mycoplasma tullyi]|uniref:DUF5454 family protein n=1 Tax=Mycoplasma tullyi TaxID=1612150 RepID=A0A7D7U4V3_9MOLU|nr:DUF5454 family protein [Mycoplasma tullyi]QMT98789.1 DUF5454 family protein [Mycoplasma tullyi]
MSDKIDHNLDNQTSSLDQLSKWEAFLEGYKNFYGFDFEWSKYIKDCKLYYGYFNIHNFIKTYGKECEEDFKRFKQSIALKKQEEINKEQAEQEISKELFNLYDQLFYADSLRSRLLISILNPRNRYEKQELKRSWKKAKAKGYSKLEWMKSLLDIPFRKGEEDLNDYQYDRDQVYKILDQIKELKKNYLNKQIKEKADRFSTTKINDFQEDINEASLVVDFHNDFATKLNATKKQEVVPQLDYQNYQQVVQDYQEPKKVETALTKPEEQVKITNPFNDQSEINRRLQKKLDQKIHEMKLTSSLLDSEFKKAELIRKQNELEYEKTKQARENLTKEIENINQSYTHKKDNIL